MSRIDLEALASLAAVPELRDWLADTSSPDEALQAHTRRAILAFEDFTRQPVTDWEALPEGARHGIIRMAAHLARDPWLGGLPAAVAALWRPWSDRSAS